MNIKIQRWDAKDGCRAIAGLLFIILISTVGVGCTTFATDTPQSPIAAEPSSQKMTLPRLEGKATVEIFVNGSPIIIELNGEEAPITAGNFADLVQRGFYNGLTFHRVVKQPNPFVAQGGDPKGDGTGGFINPETKQRRYIPLEIKLEGDAEPTYSTALAMQAGKSAPPVVLKHTRRAIAMARSQAPDSASSQFYFALSDVAFLDGDYAVFGYVTSGMKVVDGINMGDTIESAKIIAGEENLKK